jgi:hypothetical protein
MFLVGVMVEDGLAVQTLPLAWLPAPPSESIQQTHIEGSTPHDGAGPQLPLGLAQLCERLHDPAGQQDSAESGNYLRKPLFCCIVFLMPAPYPYSDCNHTQVPSSIPVSAPPNPQDGW